MRVKTHLNRDGDQERVEMKYERLFSPVNIRGCVFPNRIMLTAVVTRLAAERGFVTDVIKDRYKRSGRKETPKEGSYTTRRQSARRRGALSAACFLN